ncbi:uncharacterized protein YjbJ (UPF0337 family) [Bradyrhizobium ottawaense]|uniref:CsbD family protein n=1 Tax=Bradyrhizobium TaxID=374 RepID=UPI003518E247
MQDLAGKKQSPSFVHRYSQVMLPIASRRAGTTTRRFRCARSMDEKGKIMDREHVKGAADKAKGAIKEGAGKLTGDKDLQAEGKMDKAKGAAHNAAGDVKDAARDAADALKK